MHQDTNSQLAAVDGNGEGAMAKADLYRAAKHSMKLFQMIQDGQQLEGWVQAKITKAADYLDSIYHYMEYQVKFGGGGQVSSVQDITGDMETAVDIADEKDDEMKESMTYEQKLQALLEGAVKKAKKDYDGDGKVEPAKDEVWGSRAKAAAKAGKPFGKEKVAKEGFDSSAKTGDTFKTTKGTATKTKTGLVHTRDKYDYDPGSDDKDDKKAKRVAKSKSVKEADDKCNHTPKGKECPVHGLKECGSMYEGSTGDYSAKKARAGKDIGKPGKNFEKIAKKSGGGEKGKRIAGAVLAKLRAKG